MKRIQFIVLIAFSLVSCNQKVEYQFPFQNPNLELEERLDDMLSRMSLEDKIGQLNYESVAIESLGIPEYNWWNECLHGVARSGIATVYPQAIGLAASWDKDMLYRVADAISEEGRAKYHDYISKDKRGIYQGITFWTPNINIFRDPRWGRGMETYGECPYLTGEMAVQFINGIQGDNPNYYKAIATAKHFAVHNGPESLRHSFDARVSEHDLRNTYLPAFEKSVKKANVASIMCAYNRYEGEPCCGSSPLLQDILRDEWGFDGYVVSDCGALGDFYAKGRHEVVNTSAEAAALAFKKGTDVNCGGVSPSLTESVDLGLISEKELDIALRRLLTARFKMGMFDPDDMHPFSEIPYSVVNSKENQELALEAAQKSMVLLKNDNNTLPLSKDIKKIAVIGPNANDVEVLLANYNGIPLNPVTPLQGIINKLPNAEILYSLGCEHAENLPTFTAIPNSALYTDEGLETHGLKAEYFDNIRFEGEVLHEKIDSVLDFYWWDKAPFEDLDPDQFSARWKGVIVPPVSGKYAIGGEGYYFFEVILDGITMGRNQNPHESQKRYEFVELEAGKAYEIEVKYYDIHSDANVSLLWSVPRKDYESEAIAMAKEAEVVVMFMGLSPRLEGEEMKVRVPGFDGGDRIRIDLPDFQQDFIKKIHALGKPTILVLLNGSSLSINWENENIPAILEAWYPGQAAGTAIANVLFGDYNPAGRLPLTYYKDVNDIPEFENYDMDGFTYRYFKGEALYHFGYGLSYTNFDYTDMALESDVLEEGGSLSVSVNITNTGERAGEEVVQLYIRDLDSEDPRPIKDLRGFERFNLEPGESRIISFEINEELLVYWNIEEQAYKATEGMYEIMIGSSSRDEDLVKMEVVVR